MRTKRQQARVVWTRKEPEPLTWKEVFWVAWSLILIVAVGVFLYWWFKDYLIIPVGLTVLAIKSFSDECKR